MDPCGETRARDFHDTDCNLCLPPNLRIPQGKVGERERPKMERACRAREFRDTDCHLCLSPDWGMLSGSLADHHSDRLCYCGKAVSAA